MTKQKDKITATLVILRDGAHMKKSWLFRTTALTSVKRLVFAGVLGVGLLLSAAPGYANPLDGKVVGGSATIVQETAKKLGITQHSDKVIIDWRSFNIAAGEHTQFYQPSAGSLALNRITGGSPSEILGRLSANGRVLIVNPDGVLFGPNSRIDVAGLVATTHDIKNSDFMAGNLNFNIPGNPNASVINLGNVSVADKGIAAFVAPGVRNAGAIVAHPRRIRPDHYRR